MIVPLDHTICEVRFERRSLCVEFGDGRSLCAPLEWFPILHAARGAQLDDFVIADDGMSVAWPALGEVVSSDFLLGRRVGGNARGERML
ncbi:DUF2442 domain-containing protein [Sphingobium sp. ZW T5_29]|uniref:DUF2442 domain-containing protein n=1 Tax=Sphingobium sp. ZW T5_29 TaxID=3378077 RepID=UPI0038556610